MKIKTSELDGTQLDWAVAKCEGVPVRWSAPHEQLLVVGKPYVPFVAHRDWGLCGEIIEREWLDITPWPNESDEDLRWQCHQHDNIDCVAFGPTPLIAAMRCYAASKLGDEIDIPEELV